MSYKSFAITVRPRDGITDKTVTALTKWFKALPYSVAVLEMQSEARHLHAQIWFNEPKTKGDISKQIHRICDRTISEFDTSQLKVLRQGIKIAYSDWYLDYLVDNDNKTDDAHIIIDNPPEKTLDFYPTEEEQDKLQNKINAVDPRMYALEQSFLERYPDNLTLKAVAQFLSEEMFVNRTIKCVLQQRDRTALCKTLHAYINKSNSIDYFITQDPKIEALKEVFAN
ncbi:MAG: hypothetical protein [Circular genetic element sp.]|nr:MAG: hypothetical protein [Circular genetic element sp.]